MIFPVFSIFLPHVLYIFALTIHTLKAFFFPFSENMLMIFSRKCFSWLDTIDWLITYITLLTTINSKRKIFLWSPTVFRFALLYDCKLIYLVIWEGKDLISCSCQCHVHHRKTCSIYIASVSLVHLTSSEILACSDWSRSPADGMRTQVVQCWKAVPFVRVLDVRNSPYFLERLEKKTEVLAPGLVVTMIFIVTILRVLKTKQLRHPPDFGQWSDW